MNKVTLIIITVFAAHKHDAVKSSDLERWLNYVDMTEEEFDDICDTFRDPRVWRRTRDGWIKDNLWDRQG